MKVKNPTTGNWDKITLGGGVTIDNSLESDSTTHGASVHAVNVGLSGKISGDGSVEKIVRSETAPTGTEATIWIEPSDFNSAETTILKDTLEDEDLDKAPTVHAVKQAIDNVENIDYDSLPVRSKIEYTKEHSYDNPPAGYTESIVPYTLETVGEKVDRLESFFCYPTAYKDQIVGYWMDGKPIYRRSFSFTQWNGLGLDTLITDIDNIINASVMLKNTANSQWMRLATTPADTYYFYIKKTASTYKILIGNNSVFSADSVCAFIDYTRTADQGIGISEVSS